MVFFPQQKALHISRRTYDCAVSYSKATTCARKHEAKRTVEKLDRVERRDLP